MVQRKSILRTSGLALVILVTILTHSCNGRKEYPPITYHDFTSELGEFSAKGSINKAELQALKVKYGRFFDLWLYEIMDFQQYGPIGDSLEAVYLSDFLNRNKPVLPAINAHFKKYEDLVPEVSYAFGRLNELIGGVKQPELYSYFSQFSNYNTFVDTNRGKTVLAFSSDMFMDDTFSVYKLTELEIPEFFMRYNKTRQIPAMLVWNYLKGRYEDESQTANMLGEAVFNGKIWYTMLQVFGEDEFWAQIGYTEDEWERMIKEEGQIWRYYLNSNSLFSTDFKEYRRFFMYGNHTFGSGIPPDCPPLIGNFTGFRIVSAYMEKKELNLTQLWQQKDAGEILRASAYNPLK